MLDGIDFGDAERVRDQAADDRAAAGTDRNPAIARIADEVGDDEHVAGEAHVADDRHLAVEALVVRRLVERAAPRAQFGEARGQTLARARSISASRSTFGPRLENRKVELAEFEFEIDSPRYLDAVAQLSESAPNAVAISSGVLT